jgi:hypothetical protein
MEFLNPTTTATDIIIRLRPSAMLIVDIPITGLERFFLSPAFNLRAMKYSKFKL